MRDPSEFALHCEHSRTFSGAPTAPSAPPLFQMSAPDPLKNLLTNSRDYWVPKHVRETDKLPDALSFLRDHGSQSLPLVIRGAASHWPALTSWTPEALKACHGDAVVSVACTPDGLADAVTDGRFAQPAVEKWPLARLLDALQLGNDAGEGGPDASDGDCVPYYSAQDSSLTRELPGLLPDVDASTADFAREVLGEETAMNIWIGDSRSATTAHADPFENVYAVVRGRKVFSLRPPCDAALLPKPAWPNARWTHKDGGWVLRDVEGETNWIDHEAEKVGEPTVVEVAAGDVLYIPALWGEFLFFRCCFSLSKALTNGFYVSCLACCSRQCMKCDKRD